MTWEGHLSEPSGMDVVEDLLRGDGVRAFQA